MLRKILFFLWTIFLFIPVFSNKAQAAVVTCNAVAHSIVKSDGQPEPVPADDSDKKIAILIDIDPVNSINEQVSLYVEFDGRPYPVLNGTNLARFDVVNGHVEGRPDSKGKITVQSVTKGDTVFYINSERNTFPVGTYTVSVVHAGADSNVDPFCTSTYKIATSDTGPDNYCIAHLNGDNNYNVPGSLSFKVEFKQGDTEDKTHRAVLRRSTEPHAWPGIGGLDGNKYSTKEMRDTGISIGPLSVGTYRVEVKENYTDLEYDSGRSCFSNYFKIGTEENPGHECTSDNSDDCNIVESNKPLSLPCDNTEGPNYSPKSGCLRVKTAIGYVNTQANDFVKWALGFVLGISGGIVLIIIIISGYRLMTSQGDPEKVKNARDQLTAAIVGLLFIIFSLVILQLITHDILQLPGFGQP